jgi:hypothetical protein
MASALRLVSHQFRNLRRLPGVYSYTPGVYSYTPGVYSQTPGVYSQTLGVYSYTLGVYSHTLGVYSQTLGVYSQTLGVYSQTLGVYSQTLGVYSHTPGVYSHTLGVREPSPDTALVRPCKQLSPGQTSHLVCQLSLCYCRGRPAYSRRCELWHRLFCIAELHPTRPSKR